MSGSPAFRSLSLYKDLSPVVARTLRMVTSIEEFDPEYDFILEELHSDVMTILPTLADGYNRYYAADKAEAYNASEPVHPGEIVAVDTGMRKTVEAAGTGERGDVVGVVTTAPAILFEESRQSIGVGSNYSVNPRKPGVALVGRVPVNVSLANGPIQTGDPITVSGEEGVGMKATTSGMVVGTALEPYNASSGDSKIFVFVNPRMYVPPGTVQELKEENRKQSSRIQELERENERMQDVLHRYALACLFDSVNSTSLPRSSELRSSSSRHRSPENDALCDIRGNASFCG